MDPSSQEPLLRLRAIADFASSIKLENRIPIQRYFRSGTEMLRMADVYNKEGSLESAYALYLKFLTIFVEKIKEHPEYHTLSHAEKAQFNSKLKEIFPKTELLKQQLHKVFQQEYEQYQEEAARKKQEEILQAERKLEALRIEREKEREKEDRLKLMNEEKERPKPQPRKVLEPSSSGVLPVASPVYPISDVPVIHETKAAARGLPEFDRALKPQTVFFSPSGLRTVVIPATLLNEFVLLAHSNTQNNIETCGILAGNLAQNKFHITHLIIPKQKGNSDSCTTQNEEELFAVQDKFNLVTLGWIHTHPTQTAFLSSVDLHTHCSYQLMMPEAVAIVCAPKFNETGYFTLTPNHGLDVIASCRQSGFHPHPPNPPLFQVASHIEIHPQAHVSVIDLRKV